LGFRPNDDQAFFALSHLVGSGSDPKAPIRASASRAGLSLGVELAPDAGAVGEVHAPAIADHLRDDQLGAFAQFVA